MRLERLSKVNLKQYRTVAHSCFPSQKDRGLIEALATEFLELTREYYRKWCWYEEFLVLERGKPIGVTGVYKIHGKRAEFWLSWFGVKPPERRKGLGMLILQKTIGLAKSYGCTKFRIYSGPADKAAHALYRKAGFSVQRKPDTWLVVKGKKVWKYPKGTRFFYKRL